MACVWSSKIAAASLRVRVPIDLQPQALIPLAWSQLPRSPIQRSQEGKYLSPKGLVVWNLVHKNIPRKSNAMSHLSGLWSLNFPPFHPWNSWKSIRARESLSLLKESPLLMVFSNCIISAQLMVFPPWSGFLPSPLMLISSFMRPLPPWFLQHLPPCGYIRNLVWLLGL